MIAALWALVALLTVSQAFGQDLKWLEDVDYYHGPGCPEAFLERFDYLAGTLAPWSTDFNYVGNTRSFGEDGRTAVFCSDNQEDVFASQALKLPGLQGEDSENFGADNLIFGTTRWLFWIDSQEIYEADIWFHVDAIESESWDLMIYHELGHLLGLPHRDEDELSIMNPAPYLDEYSAEDIGRLVDLYNRCGPAYLSKSNVMFLPRIYYRGEYAAAVARLEGGSFRVLEVYGDICRAGS